MKDPIAESLIIFRWEDGRETLTSVQVGPPYQVEDVQWSCDVEIPDVDKLRTIHSVDSLHVLILALGFLADRLEHLVSKGGSVLSPDTGEPARISEVLPRL